jgi:hypothetical protein
MTEHSDATELALFVRGELAGSRRDSFEAHVARCDECAAQLASEARLELALVELGATRGFEQRIDERIVVRRRVRATGMAALAAAVVALVMLMLRDPAPTARGPLVRSIPRVVCSDGPAQAVCVELAHRHGLVVEYPPWAKLPPLGGSARDPRLIGPSTSPLVAAYPSGSAP